MEFDINDQLLIMYTAFITYLQKMKYNGAEHQLFTGFNGSL